jgi:hypothetical protein
MRFLVYALATLAIAAAPNDIGPGGCGPEPCPTAGCDEPGDTDGDDPTRPNQSQEVQLSHTWLFDGPLEGTLDYEVGADDTLVLLDVRLQRGASVVVSDSLTATWTGWPIGTEVDVHDVSLVHSTEVPLDRSGVGVVAAGLVLELDLTVVEPDTRGVDGVYRLKVPVDLSVTHDGRTVAFDEVDDGVGGAFTLR